MDLAGKFKNSAEAYDWAWKNLWPRSCHSPLSILHPDIRGLRDYLIQQRIFVWWQSGTKGGPFLYGNSTYAEKKVTLEILKSPPLNIPILGYPWAGDGVGLGEQDGVTLFSRYGKFLIPLDHAANLSVHSGAGSEGVTLRPAQSTGDSGIAADQSKPSDRVADAAGAGGGPGPNPDPKKIYVSYVVSDGDNLQAWLNFFRSYWDSPEHGTVPVFRALGSGGKNIARELSKLLAKAERPAFVHAFVLNWDHDMESLAEIRDELGPDYVFVSPDQLTELYLSWKKSSK